MVMHVHGEGEGVEEMPPAVLYMIQAFDLYSILVGIFTRYEDSLGDVHR